MRSELDKKISALNLILMDSKRKNVLFYVLDRKEDYNKTLKDHEIQPNHKEDTYSVKMVFDDGTSNSYPSVIDIEFSESMASQPIVWINEKGMKEPHYKIVFG